MQLCLQKLCIYYASIMHPYFTYYLNLRIGKHTFAYRRIYVCVYANDRKVALNTLYTGTLAPLYWHLATIGQVLWNEGRLYIYKKKYFY